MIDKIEAQRIAGEWHGGQMSALYGFASYSGEQPVENLEAALTEVRRELLNDQFTRKGADTDQVWRDVAKLELELIQLKEYLDEEVRIRTP